jgi:Ser/Thr protein kinase RdoA (MazF antagonist)
MTSETIHSTRSLANLNGEIAWVDSIGSVTVPKPQRTRLGKFVAQGWHDATGRTLNALLYSWLDGEAAQRILEVQSLEGVEFPNYSDVFWGAPDLQCGPNSARNERERAMITQLPSSARQVIDELPGVSSLQPIHGDLRPWNVMGE